MAKRQLLDLDRIAFGGFAPAQLSFCGVERQCLREQMRPVHGKRAAVELDRSVVVGCGDAAGETGDAGRRIFLREPQAGEIGRRIECAGRCDIAGPMQCARIERSTRRKAREVVPPSCRQRQIGAELPQRSELDAVERSIAVDRPAGIVMHRQLEIGRVEASFARRSERELACEDFAPRRIVVPADAAFEPGQRKLRQIAGELALDAAQDYVRDDIARLAGRDLQPHSNGAFAIADRKARRQPRAPGTDIGIVEPRVEAPGRAAPIGQRAAGEIAAHVERRREARGRRAGQSEAMTAGAIFQPQNDVLERQLRRATQLVPPGDERVADDDARLAQHPFDDALLAALFGEIQRHPRGVQHARSVAANDQARLVDRQLLQAQLEKQQRIPGDGQPHVRQGHARDIWRRAPMMRRLPMSSRGFQPSQPVATDPISTGWPICAVSRRATTSGLFSTRGKMTKRTASSNRQTAMRTINAIARAECSVLRNEVREGRGRLEAARAKGIIGRSGAILIRKGAAAALNSRMDLAGAYEFSRYAQRLRVADPGLCASVEAMLDQPFQWSDGELDGLARGSDPAALAVALRRLRQRVYLHVLLRDLTGRADLNEVCATMTRLAENAIAAAVDAHSNWLAAIHGEPLGADSAAPEQLIVVAMRMKTHLVRSPFNCVNVAAVFAPEKIYGCSGAEAFNCLPKFQFAAATLTGLTRLTGGRLHGVVPQNHISPAQGSKKRHGGVSMNRTYP